MFKIGEIVQLRKLPDSCNTCTQLQECRAYVGGYYDAHNIEYIDKTSADIDGRFYGHGTKLQCIQSSIKIPLEDLKYNSNFIKPGIYIVEDAQLDLKDIEDYKVTKEEVFEFKKLIIGKEFKVDYCEVNGVYNNTNNKYLRSEIFPIGEFLDEDLQEKYNRIEGLILLRFKYDNYALYRYNNQLPDKVEPRISL